MFKKLARRLVPVRSKTIAALKARRRRLGMETLETRRLLVAEIEPNNTFATGTAFTGTDTLTGRIQSQADVDHFIISAQAGATLQFRISTNGESMPSFDTTMEIVNAAGDVLAAAFDSHSISFQVAAAGSYGLRLTSNNVLGPFVGAYSIQATVTAYAGVTESEGNNTIATANPLSGQTNVRGTLASASDVDMFSIPLVAGQGIAIKFTEQPLNNPAVRLLNSTGTVLASGTTGLGLVAQVETSGTYLVSIAADNALRTVTGAYTAQVLISSAATLDAEAGNEFSHATYIDMGPHVIPGQFLSTTPSFNVVGLTGSYINQSLRGTAAASDWRTSQTIAGTRVDPNIHFPHGSWGTRSTVGITGGNDNDWDNYSVQWDGWVRIVTPGTQLYLASDDGSRLWVDLNGDGQFNVSGPELVNNNWGSGQGNTLSQPSVALAPGDYRIRIQYEEGNGGNLAYLLWSDRSHSAGSAVSLNQAPVALGSLSSLGDIDIYAVDLSGTGLYEFRLESTTGAMGSQSRLITLYNQYGQPLDYSHAGYLSTTGWNTRVERTGRYFVTVQATATTGLGSYELVTRVAGEFPSYRDVPLFFQNYSGYSKQAHVPAFLAFFEARYDMYQVDLTTTQPAAGVEHVAWRFTDTVGGGCGGSQGGSYGSRRPSGNGSGNCDANWTRLSDVWFGLFYHENGHGVGLFHARHPLNTMSYGGQYDFWPIGSFNWMGLNGNGDARVSNPRLFNMRDYLDWALEAGRIVPESENNDSPAVAQPLTPYIASMSHDGDARNDQVVVVGSIATIGDVDHYRLTVTPGELYSLDIDSAEFQTALDATLEIIDPLGNVVATNQGGLDRNTGLMSADPNLSFRFTSPGNYIIRVRSEQLTTGYYRLKVSPERTLDTSGPRIAGAWPDGGQTLDSTRQLTWWINDQLDPATLTSQNIVVRGATSGVRSGTATFDPFTSILTWWADAELPIDSYTVTLRSGITDLQGNALDGETDGVLSFPEVSGNGTRGGDFVSTFAINAIDSRAAAVTGLNYYRQNHERDLLDIFFDDELDVTQVNQASYTLRGAGADRLFDTADDTFAPVDVMYDPMMNMSGRLLRVYTRALLEPDNYRIQASLRDATGLAVNLSRTFVVAPAVPLHALSTTVDGSTRGLTGSYVNGSLRSYATQDDWRTSQRIAGTRIDEVVDFNTDSFGTRSDVGITGGSDANWDDFSVQWDGFVTIPANGVRLFTRSDDGSRMWIDINNDGVFGSSGNELVNNNWGSGQGVTTGPASVPLNAGRYRVRIQYEEGGGGNRMSLLWDYPDARNTNDGMYNNLKIIDTSIQPNTVIDRSPESIDVYFNQSVQPATLTTNSFRLIYSPDADFFDGNDQLVPEADGQIQWTPATRRASFQPATPLATGYYMLELNGDMDGITNLGGRLLDGEYRDGYIVGGGSRQAWSQAPSGDGLPGGDYRAIFIVAQPLVTLHAVTGTSINEAGGSATIEARLSYASIYPVTIDLQTAGSAVRGSDYQMSRTQITIAAGLLSGTAQITTLNDAIDEFDESIVISIASADNATVEVGQSVAITIIDDDLEPQVRLSLDGSRLDEAGGQRRLTATLSEPSEKNVTIELSFAGQAIKDVDYSVTATSIQIPAGSLTGSIQVFALQDELDELDEIFAIDIASLVNARNPGGQGQSLTLMDDDAPPNYTLSVNSPTLVEAGGTVTIVATLSTLSGRNVTIPLTYSGSASSADYSGAAPQIVIAAGSISGQIQLTAIQDSLDEIDETIEIQAGTAINATSLIPPSLTLTIIDDDLPPVMTLSASGSPLAEAGGQGTVTATLSNISSLPVVVDLTLGEGTATLGVDYVTSSSQIVIEPGQTSGSITLAALDDLMYERPETIVVAVAQLSQATQLGPQQVALIIASDDAPPQANFSVSPLTVQESPGQVVITATLDSVSSVPVTIELAAEGAATLGSDYNFTDRMIRIPAGLLSGSTVIDILPDELDEPDESISLRVVASEHVDLGSASVPTIVIVDDDLSPTLDLSFEADQLSESGGSTRLMARLSRVSGRDVSIQLSWGGTATLDTDYLANSTQILIPAGQTERVISVSTLPDSFYEGEERIEVSVDAIEHASLSGSPTLVLTILEDDPIPTLTVSVDQVRVAESNTLILVSLELSAVSGLPVMATLQLDGDATDGLDYQLSGSSLLPPMTTRTDLLLNILDDDLDEIDEVIVLRVGQLSNALSNTAPLTITIVDDESFSIIVAASSLSEAGGRTTATIQRSGSNLNQPLSVALFSSDTTELSVPSVIEIPANATTASFEVLAVDDTLLDGLQAVTITASAPKYLDASARIDIEDAENLWLTLAEGQVIESGGRVRATLQRSNTDVDSPLTVQLAGDWADQLEAPGTIEIPAGQQSVELDLVAVDDFFADGNREVTIEARAVGYLSGLVRLEIVDDESLRPYRNPRNTLDVNNSGLVTPLDALLLINRLNTIGPGPLPPPPEWPFEPDFYWDTSGDNFVSALDALLVINFLNNP